MDLRVPFPATAVALLVALISLACQQSGIGLQPTRRATAADPPATALSPSVASPQPAVSTGQSQLAPSPRPPAIAATPHPDGLIAFTRTGGPSDDIYLVNADGSDLGAFATDGSFNHWPSWSPDASKLAYASDQAGDRGMFDLYTLEMRTGDLRRLTSDPATWEIQPSWSPDGHHIAFTVVYFDGSANSDILLIDSGGGNITSLTSSEIPEESPEWSPTGDRIAFLSQSDSTQDEYDLSVMLADGSDKVLIAQKVGDTGLAWSPDGRWIAFASESASVPTIELVSPDGLETRSIQVPLVQSVSSPEWSPSGDWIAFAGAESGHSGIFIVALDGSAILRVTSNPLPGWDGSPTWGLQP